MSKTQYSLDKPIIAVFQLLQRDMYIYRYIKTNYDVDEKNMHIYPSPNELMFSLTSSLLSKNNVSLKPRVGRDQGPDNIAKRVLLVDGFLEDKVNSFRALREVQVLPHPGLRAWSWWDSWCKNPPAPNSLFHRTKETAIGIAVGNEMAKQKKWNLNRSRTFCLQQVLCWRDRGSSQFW